MKQTSMLAAVLAALSMTGLGIAYDLADASNASGQVTATTSSSADDSATRVAVRLQERIERRFNKATSLDAAREAVIERRKLFGRSLVVSFRNETTGEEISTWNVSLGRYPEWMRFDVSFRPAFSLDTEIVRASIATTPPDGLAVPSFATVSEVREDGKILRATVEGKAEDGQVYDADTIADDVIAALTEGKNSVTRNVTAVKGAILYDDGTKTHVLTELGVGRSEFASSPIGRKKNVRKAMNEKANGIVIPQGTTFAFNSTLGGPITYSNGWYESLIIVNGRDLEPAPGGGICQASTTVFRAAVAAGLPIAFRKSHSLYVTYYKQYGVGLDAAVFPGKQDMTFENNTPGPVVLLGMTDDADNAYSTLYGIDDERTVTMDGPYFGYTHKEPIMGRTLRNNQVGWVQRVTKPDGTTREEFLVAQYLQLPKSVALEFTPQIHDVASLLVGIR